MKAKSKSILVVAAAATAACVAAGGPSDYKKTVQRRVAPAKVECRIPDISTNRTWSRMRWRCMC